MLPLAPAFNLNVREGNVLAGARAFKKPAELSSLSFIWAQFQWHSFPLLHRWTNWQTFGSPGEKKKAVTCESLCNVEPLTRWKALLHHRNEEETVPSWVFLRYRNSSSASNLLLYSLNRTAGVPQESLFLPLLPSISAPLSLSLMKSKREERAGNRRELKAEERGERNERLSPELLELV